MYTREDIADIAAKAVRKVTSEVMRLDGMPVNEPWVQVVLDEVRAETREVWLSHARIPDDALAEIQDLTVEQVQSFIEETIRPDLLRALAPMRPS